ncbi:hypothetical protein T02_16094 [Trichinella nativa]|uniref:Uncharacterized protein n=1 Tax=Trichinella nativa TaxID=6335 RepID=A0A0V1KXU8_9BILA|nr:hypothetical protein T02_16094 [Trichinella nativa]
MPSSRAVRRRPIVQTMRTPVRRWQTLVIINQLIRDHQKEYGNWYGYDSDEAKSLSENLYNDEYNGPNARSNKVLFLWKGYSNACCFG